MDFDKDKLNKMGTIDTMRMLQNPIFEPMRELVSLSRPSRSLKNVPSIDTAGFNFLDKGKFARTAPRYRDEYTSWHKMMASMKIPNSTDTRFLNQSIFTPTSTTNGNVHQHSINSDVPSNVMPHFMQSQFFNSSSPMMDVSGYSPLLTVPQSAPSLFSTNASSPMFEGFGEGLLFGDGAPIFGHSTIMPLNASDRNFPIYEFESNILGSGVNISSTKRDRNWSTFNTNPATKKRKIDKAMSHSDLPRPQQVERAYDLPPKVVSRQEQKKRPKEKKKGRSSQYTVAAEWKDAVLNKNEREKMRRRELKKGYEILTKVLELSPENPLAALPKRPQIVAAACAEIKRLDILINRQKTAKI